MSFWCWSSNTLATWYKQLTHWKKPWCWERLKAGGEGDDRGWGGWMASPTWWTWVWASSGSWWWTGRPGVLQSIGLQSWTWLSDWTELNILLDKNTQQPGIEGNFPNLIKLKLVTQSCLTLCDPMDYSPPGSSVHGILQARVPEWVAISFSRGSSWPRDQTWVSCIARGFFTIWAKGHLQKPTANSTLNGKILKAFFLRSEIRWGCLLSPHVLEVLAKELGNERDVKLSQITCFCK